MKCQQCSTDALAETDPKSGRLRCAKCHAFVGTGTTPSVAVRQARDILKKWSTTDLLDQISSFPQVPPLSEPTGSAENLSVAQSSTKNGDQTRQRPIHSFAASSGEMTGTLDSVDDKEAKGETTNESAEILGIESANQLSEPVAAASVEERRLKESGDVVESQNVPQLSILRACGPVQSVESQGYESSTKQSVERVNGVAKSIDPGQPIKHKRRRLTRPVLNRRSASAPATPRQLQSETPQQGSDPVQKHLRVDRPGEPVPGGDIRTSTEETSVKNPRAQDAPVTRRVRIDTAEELSDLTDGGGRVRAHGRERDRYVDESHVADGLVRGPHFEISSPQRSSLTSLTGQFLAYVGVLGLTVGTAIVIYGHFGGYSEYTPTGWLVTTVAQMLLFLGIINLVSGGIEQNNNEVSRRINVLGDQLMRIEQVTETAMRGPKIPVERYSGEIAADETTQSDTVYVDERQ
ncbi:MAG: hypothetical protein MK102_05495 [Fuerstiella sp.]|nr:hypothetical protein [Fuerstiella sp.]